MSGGRLNDTVKAFLDLFRAFSRTPKQNLLRGIDHSLVVIAAIFLILVIATAGERLAITDPSRSQFQNLIAFGITIVIILAAFAACELITRYLIRPFSR